MAGENPKFKGNTRVSAIEKGGFEEALAAHRYTEIPSNQKMRILYDGEKRAEIVGFAPQGNPEDATDWLLQKFAYDGTTSRALSRTIAYGAWSLASTYSYT